MTGPTSPPTERRLGRLAGLAAAGWLVVSLLPWWELRVRFDDASGVRTETFGADVWRASTAAAAAVVVATVVTLGLIRWSGRRPRTAGQRAAVLSAAWAPVVLLGWVAWSVFRATTAPRVYKTVLTVADPSDPPPDYHVLRNHLEILTLPGYASGPAWGLFVGASLVIAVAAWASSQALLRRRRHGFADSGADLLALAWPGSVRRRTRW